MKLYTSKVLKPKWFVGIKSNYHAKLFRAVPVTVTFTMFPVYLYCYGPYNTKREALKLATYHKLAIDD